MALSNLAAGAKGQLLASDRTSVLKVKRKNVSQTYFPCEVGLGVLGVRWCPSKKAGAKSKKAKSKS